MYMVPLDRFHPDVAAAEYRFIVVEPNAQDGSEIPFGTYVLREAYCQQHQCDCRRVMFSVQNVDTSQVMATISFALEEDAPMRGPFLDPLNPQSKHAKAFLRRIQDFADEENYVDRLRRHYDLHRQSLATPDRAKTCSTSERPLHS